MLQRMSSRWEVREYKDRSEVQHKMKSVEISLEINRAQLLGKRSKTKKVFYLTSYSMRQDFFKLKLRTHLLHIHERGLMCQAEQIEAAPD